MTRSRLAAVVAVVAALLVLPILALAAPARTATLSAGAPVYEWVGAKKTASTELLYQHNVAGPCGEPPMNYCDDTLLKMDVPEGAKGTSLTVEIPATGANDFDVYVYRSNESGSVSPNSGVGVSNGEAPSAEKVTIENPTGFYVVRVVYYEVANADYPGKATLKGLAPPAATATAEPTPAPGGGGGPTEPPKPTPQPTPAPQPAPTPAPFEVQGDELVASMKVKPRRLRVAVKRGLSAAVTCSRDCQGDVSLEVDKRTARKLKLRSRTLGSGTFSLPARGTRSLSVRFTKKAAKALRKARAVKLTAVAKVSDPKKAQTVTLRRSVRLKR